MAVQVLSRAAAARVFSWQWPLVHTFRVMGPLLSGSGWVVTREMPYYGIITNTKFTEAVTVINGPSRSWHQVGRRHANSVTLWLDVYYVAAMHPRINELVQDCNTNVGWIELMHALFDWFIIELLINLAKFWPVAHRWLSPLSAPKSWQPVLNVARKESLPPIYNNDVEEGSQGDAIQVCDDD